MLATGGGLVFTGKLTGEFLALDADTGKTLWQFKMPQASIRRRSPTPTRAANTSASRQASAAPSPRATPPPRSPPAARSGPSPSRRSEGSSPSPLAGEGRGGGSGGCGNEVPHLPAPTPDPSPQGEGSARPRVSAARVGSGEKAQFVIGNEPTRAETSKLSFALKTLGFSLRTGKISGKTKNRPSANAWLGDFDNRARDMSGAGAVIQRQETANVREVVVIIH